MRIYCPRVSVVAALLLAHCLSQGAVESSTTAVDDAVNPEGSDIVAVVNGEALYIEDVASVLGEIHDGATPQDRSKFDIDQMLFRLVNDTLLAQEAKTLGMDRDDLIRAKVAGLRGRLASGRLEKEEIYSRLEVDQERSTLR